MASLSNMSWLWDPLSPHGKTTSPTQHLSMVCLGNLNSGLHTRMAGGLAEPSPQPLVLPF